MVAREKNKENKEKEKVLISTEQLLSPSTRSMDIVELLSVLL